MRRLFSSGGQLVRAIAERATGLILEELIMLCPHKVGRGFRRGALNIGPDFIQLFLPRQGLILITAEPALPLGPIRQFLAIDRRKRAFNFIELSDCEFLLSVGHTSCNSEQNRG